MIKTFDPFRQQELSQYREDSDEEVLRKIRLARKASEEFRGDIDQRKQYLRDTVKRNLERMKGELARTITMEMGKPIKQSIAEVEKCIRLVDYAVENIERFYAPEPVMTEARKSYVRFDPIGVVMAIMPWNFPVWQVMRAAVPAISAGNGVVLKHASITTGTALMIQEVFDSEAFSTLLLRGSDALRYIPHVDGVTFTGSTSVGARVAEEAGKHIKKCVLELGGSDPFIVLGSADIRETAKQAALARLQNNGQSCIASKRFLVQGSIYEEFREALEEEFSRVVQGDPMEESTYLGPLSSREQTETVRRQVEELRGLGGKVIAAESRFEQIVPPTIVSVPEGVRYEQEVFGPVALLQRFDTLDDAVRLANDTPFGLGASIWGDPEEAENLIPRIEAGMVFVNRIVASDPRMPFGGVKKSGFGRELSRYGFLEFTNIKSAWVDH